MSPINLIDLYNDAGVNRISGFSSVAANLSAGDLVPAYVDLRDAAPHRHNQSKAYFEGRPGVTSSGKVSNRREEHLAVALRNAFNKATLLQLPDGRTLRILDYQTPLKAHRNDKGIGKIDLFGVIDGSLPCVIEVKVPTASGRCSDTPLRAFLEAFTYCAVVEANVGDIAAEAAEKLSCGMTRERPALMVMAPEDYWLSYLNHPEAGEWWAILENLADELTATLKLETHFIALREVDLEMGLEGKPPRFTGACHTVTVADLAEELEHPGSSTA